MKHPSQEDLLGYVLGALDAQEERDLQEQIDAKPEIEEQLLELRHAMSPMESLTFGDTGSRPGLARRTCELVANLNKHGKQELFGESDADSDLLGSTDSDPIREMFDDAPAEDAKLEPASSSSFSFSRMTDRLVHPGSWSRVDMLACVAIMAIFASILMPAISQSRFNSRIVSCQRNLTQVGSAMLVYSNINSRNFINVSGANNVAMNAGLFAPVLKDSGLIEDDSLFACAGRLEPEPLRIPSIQQIRAAEGPQLGELMRRMGGHFGYSLGFLHEDGNYSAPRNDGSAHTIVIADMPSADLPGRGSDNHAGKGQNCFFADGHVEFVSTHTIGNDAIYENDLGIVGPGIGEHDNVIAPCHLPAVRLSFEVLSPSMPMSLQHPNDAR